MNSFDELYRALNGVNPPRPQPKPPASLSDFLRATQPKPQSQFKLPIYTKPQPKPNAWLQKATQQPNNGLPIFTRPQKATVPPIRLVAKKRQVFVSFDYENDKQYRYALSMWHANKTFDFKFQDMTPTEIKSERVDRVKAVLTQKIKNATHVLVIVGAYANEVHEDFAQIGCINWINYEMQQARLYRKKIVAVRLHPSYYLPYALEGANGLLVDGFREKPIITALNEVK